MLIKNIFFNLKTLKKIMIWDIHYFITKKNTKIDVIFWACPRLDPLGITITPYRMSDGKLSKIHHTQKHAEDFLIFFILFSF